MTKYSLETKLAAVSAYLEGVDSFKVTAQKYNVKDEIVYIVSHLKKRRPFGSVFFVCKPLIGFFSFI
ncbi:hypothetical protein [Anoxybacillus sp. TBDG-1]